MNIVALSQTILREQGRRVLHMVASAVFEGADDFAVQQMTLLRSIV